MSAHHPFARPQPAARPYKAWLWALFFFLGANTAVFAQGEVRFEASISTKEVVVGVPFEVSFTLKNAEGTRFVPPTLDGLKSGGISEMRSMSIVNGRSTSSQSWALEVQALKPGTYTIGAAQITVGGKTLRTEPLQVQVLAVSASSKGQVNVPPNTDDKIFVTASLDHKEAYPGQQVTWKAMLYTQLSVEGYDVIEMPRFEGFFAHEKIRFDKRVEHVTLRGKKYAVRTLLEESLFPQTVGELSIGPASFRVGLAQSGTQGFLFGPKPVNLSTQPLSLKVKSLPQPAPPHFCGAVGRYSWQVSADSLYISTDGAITLTIEVEGNGDARRLAAPKFHVPESCEIFEPRILEEEEYEGETEMVQRKKWEYVVLPKDTGTITILPKMAYFDPDSNRYVDLVAEPVRFHVTPGKNFKQTEPPASVAAPNFPPQKQPWESWMLWAALALPAFLLGIWVWQRRRSPEPAIAASATAAPPAPQPAAKPVKPSAQALFAARQQLASLGNALHSGDPRHFYDLLSKGLQAWLTARLGLGMAQMNDREISSALAQRGATPIRVQAFLSVWHTCEQSVYGGFAPAEQMEPTWQMAMQVIDALEKELG
jgi:hypothetical protein